MTRSDGRVVLLLCCMLIAACGKSGGLSADDIALNNRGVALMGYFDYSGARETFVELTERRPEWLDAKVNLAISTLNRQEEGDEQRALEILDDVLQRQPDHLRANYVSGLLRLYLGETEASLQHLRLVADADPEDAYAAYFIAQNLLQQGELEQTLEWYRRAIELDPYLRSAYYGAGLILRRLGEADEARDMLSVYQRFADNPRARLAEFKYTRMGAKAETLAVGRPQPQRSSRPRGDIFAEPLDLSIGQGAGAARLTVADVDGDGRLDLYRVSTSDSMLLLAGEGGSYEPRPEHALSRVEGIVASLWGDVDNDGDLDVYLCRIGHNQLWLGDADGGWREAANSTGTDDDGYCTDAGLLDADHDGDLDIFVVNSNRPNELFNNNGDGSFRRLAESQGIGGSDGGGQFLAADLDGDRDVDLLVIRPGGSEVWLNDRLWQYSAASGFEEFTDARLISAVAGDRDADGRVEIYSVDDAGVLSMWSRGHDDRWGERRLDSVKGAGPYLSLADFDGDGVLDLLAGSVSGAVVFVDLDEPVELDDSSTLAGPIIVINADAERGPGLAAPTVTGLRQWLPGPGRHAFLGIAVSGREDRAESMRSNRSGIGTRVSLRTLDRWAIADTFDRHSAPGQSLQPLLFGLGGRPQADFVALDWSDGVFQTELDLTPGTLHHIAETQRQLSSCPVVFAWDGQGYAFVSDVLGVGGLGFLVAPGSYAEPRPWEYFLMPPGLPVERDGRYQIKIAEPMEENAYLDSVRLHVVDLPSGWDVVPDERMATGAPQVTGRPIYFEETVLPELATNDRGQDVTAEISEADRSAAPPGALDPRFIGRLRDPHRLTLDFGRTINPPGTRPVMVVDGWVEYPYSQTVFAAWQANASYDPPDLEARTADGDWQMVHADFGYPAGMPRVMSLPLQALPADTVALRLSTSLEVYWDRIRIVYEETPPRVETLDIDPRTARLAKTGFPLRRNGPQRLPDYDYGVRQAFWDARYLEGQYTALGPVDELLADTDDAVVVIGSGEEVHLEFPAPAPAPGGWTRRIILETRGWAKDMDMYTRDGGRVGPLPVRGPLDAAAQARRQDLHDRYNLRFQSGR